MRSIKYDRLYSDSDGRSCVQKNLEIELVARDFVPPAPPIGVSALAPASTYAFLLVPAGFIGDWHPTPKRLVVLRMLAHDRSASSRNACTASNNFSRFLSIMIVCVPSASST
jgi:hypothetical protein